MPIIIAIKLDPKDNFLTRFGLFTACPRRREPSPTRPAVRLIVAMVPTRKKKVGNFDECVYVHGCVCVRAFVIERGRKWRECARMAVGSCGTSIKRGVVYRSNKPEENSEWTAKTP